MAFFVGIHEVIAVIAVVISLVLKQYLVFINITSFIFVKTQVMLKF